MAKLLEIGQLLIANWQQIVAYSIAGLTGLIGIALIIPGDHPDKELQAAVDFLKKISLK